MRARWPGFGLIAMAVLAAVVVAAAQPGLHWMIGPAVLAAAAGGFSLAPVPKLLVLLPAVVALLALVIGWPPAAESESFAAVSVLGALALGAHSRADVPMLRALAAAGGTALLFGAAIILAVADAGGIQGLAEIASAGALIGTGTWLIWPMVVHRCNDSSRIQRAAAAAQAGVGMLVLAGWLVGAWILTHAATDRVPMQFNTALCHVLAAASLWVALGRNYRVAVVLQVPILLITAASLGTQYVGAMTGIDELLLTHALTAEGVAPGRMAPSTAIAFLVGMLAVCLMIQAERFPQLWRAVWTSGFLVVIIGLIVLAGYLLDVPDTRTFGSETPMALMTSLAFIAYGIGLLYSGRDRMGGAAHRTFWLPILVFSGAIMLAVQLSAAVEKQREAAALKVSQLQADAVVRKVTDTFAIRTQALTRLAERMGEPHAVTSQEDHFRADATAYLRDFPSVLSLAWLDAGGRPRWPATRRSEQVVRAARDSGAEHHRQATLVRALATGQAQMSPPIDLTDGSRGMVLVLPLREPEGLRVDGLLAAEVNHGLLIAGMLQGAGVDRVRARYAEEVLYSRDESSFIVGTAFAQQRLVVLLDQQWIIETVSDLPVDSARIPWALLIGGVLAGAWLALALRFSGISKLRAAQLEISRRALELELAEGLRVRSALDESERDLGSVLESITDGVVLLDGRVRMTFVNQQAASMLGQERLSLVGTPLWDAFPDARDDSFRKACVRALQEQQTVVVQSFFSPLGVWLEVRAYPHRQGLALYMRDVTAAKQAELEKARHRAEAECAQQLAQLGSWEYEIGSGRLHWSAQTCVIFGHSPDDQPDSFAAFMQHVHPDDRDMLLHGHAKLHAGEAALDIEYRVVRSDGHERRVRELGTFVCDEKGMPLRATGAIQDITERRRVEEALRQALQDLRIRNRELGDFAFVASHDLQEPLRKIRAFSDRLLGRYGQQLDEQAGDYLSRINRAAERMQVLINDLLGFSRISSQGAAFTTVELDAVAAAVIDDLEARIDSSGGHVERGSLPTIEGDATQLRQLLQNLVANALKFRSPERAPLVRITAEQAAADDGRLGWMIAVADNGIGFEPRHAERIFGPFQRLHGRQEYEGTGIGLAIVRRIIERHGGAITADGRVGQGATFSVWLPARQPVLVSPPPAGIELQTLG